MKDLKERTTASLTKLMTQKQREVGLIEAELSNREDVKGSIIRRLAGLNAEKHPYLTAVFKSISSIKSIKGEVDTYKTPVPFYGLEVVVDGKTYTIMHQGDSDYMFTLDSFCEGTKPKVMRMSNNLFNVEYEMLEKVYEIENIDELEVYFQSKKDDLENQENAQYYKVEILTLLYCADQM